MQIVETENYRLIVSDSGVDTAGGPRLKQLITIIDGRPIALTHGSGAGTLQTSIPVIGGVASTVIEGAYFERGMEARRPDETNVNNVSAAQGGHGGAGGNGGSGSSASESYSGAGSSSSAYAKQTNKQTNRQTNTQSNESDSNGPPGWVKPKGKP